MRYETDAQRPGPAARSWRTPTMLAVAASTLLLAIAHPATAQPAADWGAVTAKAVERMGLRPGARVLLIALPGEADALVDAWRAALRSAGATELGALGSRGETPAAWQTSSTICATRTWADCGEPWTNSVASSGGAMSSPFHTMAT